MDNREKNRRSTDRKIDEIESRFLNKCSEVTASINGLTAAIKDIQTTLNDYNESGLPIMIKDFNERKIFAERSEGFAKKIIFFSKFAGALTIITGTIMTILYFLNSGHWPSSKP